MKKIYSYLDVSEPLDFSFSTDDPNPRDYLMEHEGRHYIATTYDLSQTPQSKALDLQGPYDLKKNVVLEELLKTKSHAYQRVMENRIQSYPPIGDQLDALLKYFKQERNKGNVLCEDLSTIIDQWETVKSNNPKIIL